MHSYSLIENLYDPYNLDQELLVEGFNADTAKSLLQWVVAGVAEYGVGALTLPAYGAGLAVGPVMDTLVDLMFTAEKIKSSFSVVKEINTMFDEYKTLVGAVRDAYNPSNLKNYYPAVVELIKKFVADFFKAAGDETASGITEKIESSVGKIREVIEKAIEKLISPIKAGVKLIVPDATIGLAVGEAIQATLQSLAENGFDTLVSAIENFDLFFKFITDPSACISFFKGVFESLVGMLEDVIKGIKGEPPEENQGQAAISTEIYFSNGEPLNEMLGLSIPGLGSSLTNPLKIKALEFVVSTVKKGKDLLIDLVKQMLETVVPTIITLLAIYQALMTDDWKPSNEEIEEYSGKDLEKPSGDDTQKETKWLGNSVILERQIRKLIRKLIIEDNNTAIQMYNINTHGKI